MKLNFDARTVEPAKTFEPLPAGWYVGQIVGSEGKPTKDETGGYLELKIQVLEGEHKGRILFDRLNLQNKNQQTMDIAYSQLAAIQHAVGVIVMNDTEELHGKPLLVKVAIRPAQGSYGPQNDVKGYKALEEGVGNAAGVGGNSQGVPGWAGGSAKPADTAPAATKETPPATSAGFTFGGIKGGASAPSGPAADAPTPKWALPANDQQS